jgi:hypothetical protein
LTWARPKLYIPGAGGSGQIQSQELTHMNWAYLRCEVLRSLWNRKLTVRGAALIFAGVASIGIAYGALQAQDRAGLDSILDEIAAGREVSPRVSLPLQVGFFNGATALYITPEVGVDPNAPAAVIAARNRSPQGSTPISFLKTSARSLTLRRWMTSSCLPILSRKRASLRTPSCGSR